MACCERTRSLISMALRSSSSYLYAWLLLLANYRA